MTSVIAQSTQFPFGSNTYVNFILYDFFFTFFYYLMLEYVVVNSTPKNVVHERKLALKRDLNRYIAHLLHF